MLFGYLFLCAIYLSYNNALGGSSLKEKIYLTLDNNEYHMCFKRLNETHQVGCGSGSEGNVGILHLLESIEDMEWLRSDATDGKYVVLMSLENFTESTIKEFIKLKKIVGVLIDRGNESEESSGFSPDSKIPNEKFNIYNSTDVEWNAQGNSLMFLDIPFAMAILTNSATIDKLKTCYRQHNRGLDGPGSCPWCVVRMKSFMHAAVDSVVCHRRSRLINNLSPESFCDPLGNRNVMVSTGAWNSTAPFKDRSVIMLAARMDTMSMFDGISPGFDSSVTGFVALHAIADIVGQVKKSMEPFLKDTPVVFALFDGESFGYIGSKRMVYDMEMNELRYLNLSSIRVIIELNQLGVHRYSNGSDVAWIHVDEDVNRASLPALESVVDLLTSEPSGVRLVKSSYKLPPSSVQSFLKKDPNIVGIVISNHEAAFTNRFYNSFLDDKHNLDMFVGNLSSDEMYTTTTPTATYIQGVANVVACAVYKLVTTSPTCDFLPATNATYVNNLFYCFGKDPGCELFSAIFNAETTALAKHYLLQRYVGVYGEKSFYVAMVHQTLLVRSLGERVNMSRCEEQPSAKPIGTVYIIFSGDRNPDGTRNATCHVGYSLTSEAVTPIFAEQDLPLNSGFSLWTESRWLDIGIDVFLLPCFAQELKTVLLGVMVVVLSLPSIMFVNFRLFRGQQ